MNEVWRDIPGFEGLYQASDLGHVKGLDRMVKGKGGGLRLVRGRILKPSAYGPGYLRVQLTGHRLYLVHRLIAQTFPDICGEWFEGCVVNHKNRIISDCRAVNLEVCTQSYNVMFDGAVERRKHSFKNSEYVQKHLGYNNPKLSKPIGQYTLDGRLIKIWPSLSEAARQLGLRTGSLTRACRGERKTYKGFIWKYINE